MTILKITIPTTLDIELRPDDFIQILEHERDSLLEGYDTVDMDEDEFNSPKYHLLRKVADKKYVPLKEITQKHFEAIDTLNTALYAYRQYQESKKEND